MTADTVDTVVTFPRPHIQNHFHVQMCDIYSLCSTCLEGGPENASSGLSSGPFRSDASFKESAQRITSGENNGPCLVFVFPVLLL